MQPDTLACSLKGNTTKRLLTSMLELLTKPRSCAINHVIQYQIIISLIISLTDHKSYDTKAVQPYYLSLLFITSTCKPDKRGGDRLQRWLPISISRPE